MKLHLYIQQQIHMLQFYGYQKDKSYKPMITFHNKGKENLHNNLQFYNQMVQKQFRVYQLQGYGPSSFSLETDVSQHTPKVVSNLHHLNGCRPLEFRAYHWLLKPLESF